MLRRRLLTILFIFALLPIVLVFVQSVHTISAQREMTTKSAGRYVRDLAFYAADRWSSGSYELALAFLALVADHGYDMITSAPDGAHDIGLDDILPMTESMKGKFVPGMVGYITLGGRLIACSHNAEILGQVFESALEETGGRVVGAKGYILGAFTNGEDDDVEYVAYIAPTDSPRVYAVAAVTMFSWIGRNDVSLFRLSVAGILAALICIAALLLLRASVISPLRSLSSQVDTLKWGEEMPHDGARAPLDIGVEEITSLKRAVSALASRMIEKSELEARYVGDIIKAQEEERGRIAQDIHDGPIQAASALVQKIQITSLTSVDLPQDTHAQLASAEAVADDLVKELRGICDSLVPPWVSLGLASCIEESAARLERQHGISISVDADSDADVPQNVTLAIFRIFQEAVSNAVRHGGAREVRFESASRDGELVVTIRDDGTGFDPAAMAPDDLMREGKRGLNGMRQRAELLGGTCEMTSEPAHGTTITLHIPV